MDHGQLVKVYIKIRDKRAEIKKAYEAEDTALKEKLTQLENAMLASLQASGSESVRTEAGTFYRQEEVKPAVADWAALYDFIKANDAFDALERRVTKTFVVDYMERHNGDTPPGVSVYRQFVARVRRN